jgi:hypothetical protein
MVDGFESPPRLRQVVGTGMTVGSLRLERVEAADAGCAALLSRLLTIAPANLALSYHDGQFAFRLDGSRDSRGDWTVTRSGDSRRYAAIAALGLLRLSVDQQREVLAGDTCHGLITKLVGTVGTLDNPGDAAMICWAAAEASHDDLNAAIDRMVQLNLHRPDGNVVDAAWTLSALVAARKQTDVESHLAAARERLLAARGAAIYPHRYGDRGSWYRAHVGSFADQVYPLQALARLHASSDDPAALAVADRLADAICAAQGESGQWWWHYDSRSGAVVEGYPVYIVHQHSMAPMALLDLADAGGQSRLDAICRGLAWLASPAETSEALVLDEPPTTWRKVARGDPRKAIRGLRAATTRIRSGLRLSPLDVVFRPNVVDHECRPYELGWLLMTWLS